MSLVFFRDEDGAQSAQDFIPRQSAVFRDRLTAALDRALQGFFSDDGTVELKRSGVTLRAPSEDRQVRAFDAELECRWRER